MYKSLIVRMSGEIAIKGKNRAEFEKKLMENMRLAVKSLAAGVKVNKIGGRIEVQIGDAAMSDVVERLTQVMGIVSVSPVAEAELDIEQIQETAVRVVQDAMATRVAPVTFKVDGRRANKRFPLPSPELARTVGGYVLPRVDGLKVDVHDPELVLTVEVREHKAYLTCEKIAGPGGMPVGTAGRVLLLLSGGIDSPVAGWMALKRGATLEAIHFHSFPFTSERAQEKVNDLAKQLAQHGGRVRLHNVPFTEIQKAIRQHCPEEFSITIMRRIMLRIAEKLAWRRKCLALVTGESLGQVASQTLESMFAINQVTSMPILRPLVAMDKSDIIQIAKQIDTYETSILPFEDCCTIFLPKNPKTRPKLGETLDAERPLLDSLEQMIEDALNGTESLLFTREQDERVIQ